MEHLEVRLRVAGATATPPWRDFIVGDRVRSPGFSNHEWSLVMTAVFLEDEGVGE